MPMEPLISGQESYCAELTRQNDEPIYGSATEAKYWFLLEYGQPWRSKAVTDNDLPLQVQDFLSRQLAAIPHSRLLFIKQQQVKQEKLRFFVVKTAEIAPTIYEFDLNAYEDLLTLNIAAIVAEQETYNHFKRENPLFLVCTNGKRDRCCAKFGRPVYEALQQSQGEAVWQSSHIGGHRYAPTLLFLPHGVNFGLFTPEEAQAAVDACLDGQIHDLARYRGRTYYAPHVQAADFFLRQELDYHTLAGIQLRTVQPVEENSWIVQFDVLATGGIHELRVQRQMTAHERLVSCSSPAEKVVPRYRLVEYAIV